MVTFVEVNSLFNVKFKMVLEFLLRFISVEPFIIGLVLTIFILQVSFVELNYIQFNFKIIS
jgi:hypothetical protein